MWLVGDDSANNISHIIKIFRRLDCSLYARNVPEKADVCMLEAYGKSSLIVNGKQTDLILLSMPQKRAHAIHRIHVQNRGVLRILPHAARHSEAERCYFVIIFVTSISDLPSYDRLKKFPLDSRLDTPEDAFLKHFLNVYCSVLAGR